MCSDFSVPYLQFSLSIHKYIYSYYEAHTTKGICRSDDNKKRFDKKTIQMNRCGKERKNEQQEEKNSMEKLPLFDQCISRNRSKKTHTHSEWDNNSIESASAIPYTQLIWRVFITKCLNIVHIRRMELEKYLFYTPTFRCADHFFLSLHFHIYALLSVYSRCEQRKVNHWTLHTTLRRIAASI